MFSKLFKFYGKKEYPHDLVDLHSHILWGLDDGCKNFEEATLILKAYKELGYCSILATPHTNHYMFETPGRQIIQEQIQQLIEIAEKMNIELKAAGEIMLRDNYLELFEKKAFLGIGNTFLVEFTNEPGSIVKQFEQLVFKFRTQGITLLIAHPERYPELGNDLNFLLALKNRGALFQMNISSLTGFFGKKARDTAYKLLKNKIIDVAATDIHNACHQKIIRHGLNLLYKFDKGYFNRLTKINPGYIFYEQVDKIE